MFIKEIVESEKIIVNIPLTKGSEKIRIKKRTKECATFTIDKNNINVFIEILKMFGTLSVSHNYDVIEIIKTITDS